MLAAIAGALLWLFFAVILPVLTAALAFLAMRTAWELRHRPPMTPVRMFAPLLILSIGVVRIAFAGGCGLALATSLCVIVASAIWLLWQRSRG